MFNFDLYSPLGALLLIAAVALVHGSFQLGVNVLAMLGGRLLGQNTSHRRVLRLGWFYILGSLTMIFLLASALLELTIGIFSSLDQAWLAATLIGFISSLAIILFYYRLRSRLLWLPKPFAVYLQSRAEKTSSPVEAFSLGLVTTLGELPFILAPILFVGLIAIGLDLKNSGWLLIIYSVLCSLPLIFTLILIAGGQPVSRFARWRNTNKAFLQFSSGCLLMVISLFLFVNFCVG